MQLPFDRSLVERAAGAGQQRLASRPCGLGWRIAIEAPFLRCRNGFKGRGVFSE
jgi:hypothetical protein